MKRRFKRYISYLIVRYVPGTSKLAAMEAKRLAEYIFDNYDCNKRLIILDEIKQELIDKSENHIKNKEIELFQAEINLKKLKNNFDKLLSK
jgi:hypothetical protein